MNSLIGWIREKMGRSTYKAVLLQPVINPLDMGTLRYEAVKAHYFKPNDLLWKNKHETYELHAENVSYQRGEAKLLFINRLTGGPVAFGELGGTVFSPEALTQVIAAEWARYVHASLKGAGMGALISIVLFGFGLTVGALLGLNWEAIMNAVQGGSG